LKQTENHSNPYVSLLKRASIGSLCIKVAGAGNEFILSIILARVLGVNGYGAYVLSITWVMILAMLATMGFDSASIRFIPEYVVNKKWTLLRGLLIKSCQMIMVNSFGLVLLVILFTFLFDSTINTPLRYASFLIPLLSVNRFRQSGLRALKHVVRSEFPEFVIRPVLLAGLLIGFSFYYHHTLTPATAILLTLSVAMVISVIGGTWLYRLLPSPVSRVPTEYTTKYWIAYAFPMLLFSGLQLVNNYTDIIMIGSMMGSEFAGIYSAASRISILVTFGLMATNSIVAPIISELHSLKMHQELQQIITLAARGAFVFTISVGAFIALAGPYLLSFFGSAFFKGYPALLILLLGQTINAVSGSVGLIMILTGHHVQAARIFGLSAMLNIIFNAILIPFFGIVGAAVATAITTALWNIVMIYFVVAKLKINPTVIRVSNFKTRSPKKVSL
jgi:O-antigen/teichoic acid export membrane protein